MLRGYNESKLADSEIFKDLNQLSEVDQVQKAMKLIKGGAKKLSFEDIEAAYIQLKQMTSGVVRAGLKAFDSEDIILLYNDLPSSSVVQALPFITFRSGDKFVTYVFMDKYIRQTRDGISLQATDLRDLLVGGLISNRLKVNYDDLTGNQSLQRVLMTVYGKFVSRILNKVSSFMAEKITYDVVLYYIHRFFLENVFRSRESPESIQVLSTKHFKYVDEIKAGDIKTIYDQADPKAFSALLELIKSSSPLLRGITRASFLSEWINYYYQPAMLAIDTIEYLLFMIMSILHGNNIISISASDMVKETPGIKNLQEELLKIL